MYGNLNYYQPNNNYRPPQMPQYTPPMQSYTQPVIHADIIQVSSETEAESFGVAAGTTQLMCAKDDSAFYVKTAYPNGEYKLEVYERRQPKPIVKPDYVTRQELNEILSQYQAKRENKYEHIRESKQSTAETGNNPKSK